MNHDSLQNFVSLCKSRRNSFQIISVRCTTHFIYARWRILFRASILISCLYMPRVYDASPSALFIFSTFLCGPYHVRWTVVKRNSPGSRRLLTNYSEKLEFDYALGIVNRILFEIAFSTAYKNNRNHSHNLIRNKTRDSFRLVNIHQHPSSRDGIEW